MNRATLATPGGLLSTMRNSAQLVLEQLDKVMFKKSDIAMTFTIMFTLCVITVAAEMRLEYLTRLSEVTPVIIQDYCQSLQTQWHDTIMALFVACKDLDFRGGNVFELTSWKVDFGESHR